MSDLSRGFLEDIVANPDDDTPRLVYADWLDEQGDADSAEFIRVQIERTRLPEWDGRQVRLRLRHPRRQLLQAPLQHQRALEAAGGGRGGCPCLLLLRVPHKHEREVGRGEGHPLEGL